MNLESPDEIVKRLREFQAMVRRTLSQVRTTGGLHAVSRTMAADTIYRLDTHVEPLMEAYFADWGRQTPLVLVAEGLHDDRGHEGAVTYPRGFDPDKAAIRIIVDPVDGTRELMYDKRAAWSLAGVAPNKGPNTRLRDIEVAVMTELPTSKMGFGDILWATKGRVLAAFAWICKAAKRSR